MTQQAFAHEVIKGAIITVNRWETSHPPSGDNLLRLAEIAEEHGLTSIEKSFEHIYVESLPDRIRKALVRDYGAKL